MERYIRWFLYSTVFITGAAVLVVEVVAVRMFSPHFGSSLYVFSSVLTIILAALSGGYYVGGKMADRLPHHEPLFGIITFSGVLVLVSEYVALHILPYSSLIFSVFTGPLVLGAFLFFLPAFLLGIVSPYVIRLQSAYSSEDTLGAVVGATFFWGTMGSITGSLLTGFVLVPFLGVTASMVVTACVLVILGIVGLISMGSLTVPGTSPYEYIAQYRRFILLVLMMTAMLIALIHMARSAPIGSVLYQADGRYSQIVVYEGEHLGHPIRILKQDTNNSSGTYLDSYNLPFGYTQFAEFYRSLKPETERFLMIGAGTYSIPRTLVARDPEIIVDVVELEPKLLDLAQRYFDVHDVSRINTFTTDARVYITQSTTTYGVIFGDAFGTDLSIPAHLATYEFFREVKKDLKPEGIFMLNYIGSLTGSAPTLTGSLARTLATVFPNTRMYALDSAHPERRQNIIFIARNGETPIDLSGERITLHDGSRVDVSEREVSVKHFLSGNERMLTDDHAPIEYLMLAQY